MFNTDTTVPDWEKSPENHTENLENTEDARRAEAWNEAFPDSANTQNPWQNANMEAETPNQLNNTDNIVAEQMQQVWNDGNGGTSLDAAYDDMRGSFSAEDINASAEAIEPEVANTISENEAKNPDSEGELAFTNNLDQEAAPITDQQQAQTDLYSLTTSAGATAMGAQASAEMAEKSLQQNNDMTAANEAMRDLEEAQKALENIQSEVPTVANQLNQNPLAQDTANATIRDAQRMVAQAQDSLTAAQNAATERQEFIENNQATIDNLQDQGVQMKDINQAIDETGGVQELQNEIPQTGEEDEYVEPRVSIFG